MTAHRERLQERQRTRRPHAKSRRGCGNCKLRRVKCDETRPRCTKCLNYGVCCNYDGTETSLDLSAKGAFQVKFARTYPSVPISASRIARRNTKYNTSNIGLPRLPPPMPTDPFTVSLIDASFQACTWETSNTAPFASAGTIPSYTFTTTDLHILKRFQNRTIFCIGTREIIPTYRECVGHLALNHPFLMHMVLGITLLHDTYLCYPSSRENSSANQTAYLHHWSTAVRLFSAHLARPLPPSSRDAVWATGALLGAAVFAWVDSDRPEDNWPLKPDDPSDLAWLHLTDGKKAIWKIADPSREDSVFHRLAQQMHQAKEPDWVVRPNLSIIPQCWKRLFDIQEGDSVNRNPYLFPVLALTRIHGITPTNENILDLLAFMGHMPAAFKGLITEKDPRALVLLLWWLRGLEGGELWWIKRRAEVEGRALEIWLERWLDGLEGGDEFGGVKGRAILRGTFGQKAQIFVVDE